MGAGRRRRGRSPGRLVGRLALGLTGGAVLAFLIVPVVAVIPMSFSSSMIFELIPAAPGFTQYRKFFGSADWVAAVVRSVEIASGTTLLATTLGTLAALGLDQLHGRTRGTLEALLIAPRIVPSIVFAVAAYFVFSQAGLVGTVAGLVLAHTVIALPFVVVLTTSALYGLDRTLLDASRSLGAGPATTFWRVTFPHIRLAVLGSALFAFHVSFDEVVVTLFLSGVHTKTLPVKVWDAILFEITPILPAISTVIIVTSALLLTPFLVFARPDQGRASSPR